MPSQAHTKSRPPGHAPVEHMLSHTRRHNAWSITCSVAPRRHVRCPVEYTLGRARHCRARHCHARSSTCFAAPPWRLRSPVEQTLGQRPSRPLSPRPIANVVTMLPMLSRAHAKLHLLVTSGAPSSKRLVASQAPVIALPSRVHTWSRPLSTYPVEHTLGRSRRRVEHMLNHAPDTRLSSSRSVALVVTTPG